MARRKKRTKIRTKAGERKFDRVLGEAAAGTLRTSAGGKPVSRAQELAIAFSEASRSERKRRKRKRRSS